MMLEIIIVQCMKSDLCTCKCMYYTDKYAFINAENKSLRNLSAYLTNYCKLSPFQLYSS